MDSPNFDKDGLNSQLRNVLKKELLEGLKRDPRDTFDNDAEENNDQVVDHCSPSGSGDRKAIGVDQDIKERNIKRLRRIEGQVRGLQRMVEDDRYCADVMMQIASVYEALRGVGKELMRNHLKHCAADAIKKSDESAEKMYDELVDMIYRHGR